MKLQLVLLIVPISQIYPFNIKDTSDKLSKILENYSKNYRFRRTDNHTTTFARSALNVMIETERFGEFLKYLNVSECTVGGNASYVKRHIHHGILVTDDVPESHWHEYKRVYKKSYAHERHEEVARRHWSYNLRHVARHNREYLAGTKSYALHLNHLGDLHTDVYIKRILKLMETAPQHDPAQDHFITTFRSLQHHPVPRRVDWRSAGFKPRREQQHGCGACYAFAVTHALQAQLYRKHKDWSELSPQQIVDCSGIDGNSGCDGGSLRAALRYVAREGLMMERHYPYIGMRGICLHHSFLPHVKPRRWAMLPPDEGALEKALATIGPLAVGVNASPKSFQLYRSGIYDDPQCTPWGLNHAMLLVGYSPQYWLLLNWWGPHWGEDGYMRIRRGFNRCGVANMAAYIEL